MDGYTVKRASLVETMRMVVIQDISRIKMQNKRDIQ